MGSAPWPELGPAKTPRYEEHYELTTQFEAAERIAEAWNLSRDDLEEFAVLSQSRAADAIASGRFTRPDRAGAGADGDRGRPARRAADHRHRRGPAADDEGGSGRLEGEPARPSGRREAHGRHVLADFRRFVGAAAGRRRRAEELGLRARARVVDSLLVGNDPVMMLTGPIPATQQILDRNSLTLDDIDVVEINEAFASVVLAWAHETKADLAKVNVNGGAIALGHPLGATGGVCSPRRSTSSNGSTAATHSSPCASAGVRAPARSSSVSSVRPVGPGRPGDRW